MDEIQERIAAWEAAGVIDAEIADRLRATEAARSGALDAGAIRMDEPRIDRAVQERSAASAMFGPGVSIAEVFGYLGGAFLIAAWSSFIARASGTDDGELVVGALALLAAAVLTGLGLRLRREGEAGARAAGVAFVLASSYVAAAAFSLATGAGLDLPGTGIAAAAAALTTAVGLRLVHPSVLTQVGVLAWATSLAGFLLAWLQEVIVPGDQTGGPSGVVASGPDPIVLVLASAAWWLATAVLFALVGLREARAADRDHDPAAGRRAAISRFWAGLTAVIGLATAVSRTQYLTDFEYGRVLEPWIGDLALVLLSVVLIERAFRRDATAFIYAAALGLMVALTDFNVSYLSGSTESALLVEGLILLAVGVAADRLRRRVGQEATPPMVDHPRTAADAEVANDTDAAGR